MRELDDDKPIICETACKCREHCRLVGYTINMSISTWCNVHSASQGFSVLSEEVPCHVGANRFVTLPSIHGMKPDGHYT